MVVPKSVREAPYASGFARFVRVDSGLRYRSIAIGKQEQLNFSNYNYLYI
jgi:hypothetical protein